MNFCKSLIKQLPPPRNPPLFRKWKYLRVVFPLGQVRLYLIGSMLPSFYTSIYNLIKISKKEMRGFCARQFRGKATKTKVVVEKIQCYPIEIWCYSLHYRQTEGRKYKGRMDTKCSKESKKNFKKILRTPCNC